MSQQSAKGAGGGSAAAAQSSTFSTKNESQQPTVPLKKEDTLRELSSQMTGRFSSPDQHALFGRNAGAGNGIPLSTASFKLNVQHTNSKSNLKNEYGDDDDACILTDEYHQPHQDSRAKYSAQKPASFLDSNPNNIELSKENSVSKMATANTNLASIGENGLLSVNLQAITAPSSKEDSLEKAAHRQKSNHHLDYQEETKATDITAAYAPDFGPIIKIDKEQNKKQQTADSKQRKTEMKTIEHGSSAEDPNGGGVFNNNENGALDLKKQSHSANMNLISYQTASFGQNNIQQTKNVNATTAHALTDADSADKQTKQETIEQPTINEPHNSSVNNKQNSKLMLSTATKETKVEQTNSNNNNLPNQQMFASMSDLNFIAAAAAQSSSTKFQSIQSNSVVKTTGAQQTSAPDHPQPILEESTLQQKQQKSVMTTVVPLTIIDQQQNLDEQLPPTKPDEVVQTTRSIITSEQRLKMTDSTNHWKVRTSTIDEIHIAIQSCIETDPDRVLSEAESLLEFFVSLLSDQNFKIVLMTLSIVNLVISMPQHMQINNQSADTSSKVYLSSASLGKHITRLVGKLADSKNIIRQQAIRALIGFYLIMRSQSQQASLQKPMQSPLSAIKGQKNHQNASSQNNFVPLVLPYLCNSSSWHVREELLNVLVICFLKSKNIEAYGNSVYEFDQYKILEVLLQMLDDSKERIRFTALEAIVAFVSIGNKMSAQEIIYQLGDNSISELIKERLKAPPEMSPYLNDNGALELPYLENVEIANQMQVDQILQRRQGLNSGPTGQIKSLSSHPMNHMKRGNSSGRKGQIAPPSANSLANAAHNATGNKRTASANNPKYLDQVQVQYQNSQAAQLINNGGGGLNNLPAQLHVQLGHSATQAKKNMLSPLFNVAPAATGQATAASAHSEFGGSSHATLAAQQIQQQQQQYGNSFRQGGHQRQSNERVGSGSSSFLPQLHKQNSVRGAPIAAGSNLDTPSQQHHMYSPHAQLQIYGASAGPLASPSGGLHGMVLRGQPTSENRVYSQHGKGSSGSSFNHQQNYNRKVSANSQHHPSHLLSRGSDGGSQGIAGVVPPNQLQLQNNLSNHPVHVLRHGRGSQQSDGVTSPMPSSNQGGGYHQHGSFIGNNDRNNLLSGDGISQYSGDIGANLGQGFLAIPQAGNVPAPGFIDQFQNPQQQQQNNNKKNNQLDTQSSYYSRKNTHSQGSYNAVGNLHVQKIGSYLPVNSFEGTTQQTDPTQSMIYSQQNSNSRGQPVRYQNGLANKQQQLPVSGGSIGEGPLQVTPQRVGQPYPSSQNKVVRNGNTFYSDSGSMKTNTTNATSTHMANRLKQKQQMKLQLGGNSLNTAASASAKQQQLQSHGDGIEPEGDANTMANVAVMGVQRGPIKATRQAVIKKDDSQRSLQGTGANNNSKLAALSKGGTPATTGDAQANGLYIDSRKPKRPLGSESYQLDAPNSDLNDFMNNYQLPPKGAAESQRNAADLQSRKSNITVLSSDAKVHPSGVNSELAGNLRSSAYGGSKNDLTSAQLEIGAQNSTANKNYLTTEELTPIEPNARKIFKQALENLVSSADWNVQFDACNEIRRACKFHQDLILQHGATLHSLVKQLTKLADSLRSSLSRIALLTIRDMFHFLKRCMETYLDPIVKILLKRAADTSAFISEEAEAALLTMTVNCSDSKILACLLGQQQVNSKSNLQRLRICQCLCQLVGCMGNNILFFKDSDKLISQLANNLKDASQDVRDYAKKAFLTMSHAIMGQNDLEKLLQRVLNEAQYKKVRGFLDTEAQNPSEFFSNVSLNKQSGFVIKTAAKNVAIQQQNTQLAVAALNGSNNNASGGTPTSAYMVMGQNTLATPVGSVQGSHVALGQNATKQMRAQGAAKGTLRTGPMHTQKSRDNQLLTHSASGKLQANGGGNLQQLSSRQEDVMKSGLSVQSAFTNGQQQSSNGDLNIKATQIVNPQKIIRIGGRPNLKTKGSGVQASVTSLKGSEQQASQSDLHNKFTDQVKEISLKVQVQDWRMRIEQIDSLFSLISEHISFFQSQQKPFKMSEVCDIICKLLGDQNAKIQLNTLDRFQSALPSIQSFLEANIVQFFTQMCQCLASMNSNVRKTGEATLCKIYEHVNRGSLVQPICNEIQYSQSARLKPILIDHLSDYVTDQCSIGQMNKMVLPLAFKMLDDTRTEVKQKTEKLVKKLHFLVGNQVIDMCPQNKMQRVQDIVANAQGLQEAVSPGIGATAGNTLSAGGGTFGAVGAANLILQNQQINNASSQQQQNSSSQINMIGHQTNKSSATSGNY